MSISLLLFYALCFVGGCAFGHWLFLKALEKDDE